VLSAGLLIGSAGGAIAWADTESGSDSSGSTAESQPSEGLTNTANAASEPAKPVAGPLRTTLQSMTTVLRSLQKFAQPQARPDQTGRAAPIIEDDAEGLGGATADSGVAPSDSDAIASDQNVVASDQNVVASDQNVVASDQNVVASDQNVVQPVTNAVATVASVALSVPGVIAALPASPKPVADVIALMQEMLTTVTNALVPLATVPTDLASLLLGMPAATAGGGVGTAASAPVLATPASQWLEVPPIALVGAVPLAESIAPVAILGDIALTGLRHELPASGIVSPTENGVVQTGLGSFLEHTVSALLVPASLSALAAVALPGVGGLLIICAAGARIGYRQAKAMLEVRRAGIATFAGPGPLGVVRSGALVALRPRASRVVRPDASRAARLLEQAA